MLEKEKFQAGAGVGTIRFPGKLFPLEGFYKVHDDPMVRVLILGAQKKSAIVSIELVMLTEDVIEQCRQIVSRHTQIETENIWIHMTHAIATPHIPKDARADVYCAAVCQAVEEASARAADSIVDAKMGVGVGISDLIVNRDIETADGMWIGKAGDGPTNKLMTVLRFENMKKEPIAFLVSYAMKPCVLDNSQKERGERQVSSDAPGLACRLMEERCKVPVLFCMSAAGDQIPREVALYDAVQEDGSIVTIDLGVKKGISMMKELGFEMAQDAMRIADRLPCVPIEKPVEVRRSEFRWKTKQPMILKPQKQGKYTENGETSVEVGVMRIGPLVIIAGKPEMNCITELHLKAKSMSKYTIIMTMVNGGMRYMPDENSYAMNSWEAMSSLLMPGAAEKFIDVASEMVREVNRA